MSKLEQLRQSFDKYGIDGIVITDSFNRRYISGFTGSTGIVLISKTDAKFITDFRYTEQAASQCVGFEILDNRNMIGEVAKQVGPMNITKLGFEQDYLTYKQYNELTELVDVECVPVSGLVEDIRQVKTPEEIEKIRTAVAISDHAFTKILDFIRPGITEMEINHKLEAIMREEGATSSSFNIIVASGERSALPHGAPTNRVIKKGDMLTMDFGALYEGYRSDITRTVAIGQPTEEMKNIYDIVYEALNLGIAATKNGVSCKAVDVAIRNYITEKGYGENFGHGAGHGIGLDIHEDPYFSQKSVQYLKTGMIMTIEPGIYLNGKGGVRIEEDVLVTDDGCEILTKSPKELIIIE